MIIFISPSQHQERFQPKRTITRRKDNSSVSPSVQITDRRNEMKHTRESRPSVDVMLDREKRTTTRTTFYSEDISDISEPVVFTFTSKESKEVGSVLLLAVSTAVQ